MFPHIQIFLQQMLRGKSRLVLNVVLLSVVTAFFVVSLNLYDNSTANLRAVEKAYKIIATVEVYGDVTESGKLVSAGDPSCVGRYLLSPEDLDLSAISNLPGVAGYDLRQRYAAYLPEEVLVQHITAEGDRGYPKGWIELVGNEDVLRFTINCDKPIEIPITVKESGRDGQVIEIPVRLLEQQLPHIVHSDEIYLAMSTFWPDEMAAYTGDIKRLNRSDRADVIILYPDVEYVLAGYFGAYFETDIETGNYRFKANKGAIGGDGLQFKTLSCFNGYLQSALEYDGYGNVFALSPLVKEGVPYRLQRYEDVKDDPEWAKTVKSIVYTNQTLPLTLTNDITSIPAWYKGGMYLQEGRLITDAEYASGAKVCMISAKTAEYQGWKIGDKLKLQCYDFDGFYDKTGTTELTAPWYYQELDGFFHEGSYEIVGIFGQAEVSDMGDTAEEVFYNPWNTIYVPTSSVENAPDDPVQASTLTILLENGSGDVFKTAMEELGVTEQKDGAYQLKVSCFDQGYDKIKPSLDEMRENAKLLLQLSAVLLVMTMVLTAFLFSRQHKHSAGILRMLGGSKKQTFAAIIVCAALLAAVGGLIGAGLGSALTQSVGASTLGDVAESTKVALSTSVNPVLTMLSGIGCMALFLLLTVIFIATYIGKEPRELLPQEKG